jgi:hypothetical protein
MGFSKGDVIKTDKWAAVVLEIYVAKSGEEIIKVWSPKNVMKGQPFDLIEVARFPKIEQGTIDDLRDDINHLLHEVNDQFTALRKLVNTEAPQ